MFWAGAILTQLRKPFIHGISDCTTKNLGLPWEALTGPVAAGRNLESWLNWLDHAKSLWKCHSMMLRRWISGWNAPGYLKYDYEASICPGVASRLWSRWGVEGATGKDISQNRRVSMFYHYVQYTRVNCSTSILSQHGWWFGFAKYPQTTELLSLVNYHIIRFI